MRKYEHYTEFHDFFEYCGTNEIKRVRIKGGRAVRRDWFVFETIDEAVGFFRRVCGALDGYCTGASPD